jgi:hypothetical protein
MQSITNSATRDHSGLYLAPDEQIVYLYDRIVSMESSRVDLK